MNDKRKPFYSENSQKEIRHSDNNLDRSSDYYRYIVYDNAGTENTKPFDLNLMTGNNPGGKKR